MRICVFSPFYDDVAESVLEVTGRYRHIESLAAALARRKHEVVVVQGFHDDRVEQRNSVEIRYARSPYRPTTRLEGGFLGADLLARGNLKRLLETVADVRPDAVHMIGVTLLQPLLEIGQWCSRTGRPLTVTFHGGRPRRARWLQPIQRRILKNCHRVFFTTKIHARAWLEAGLLREEQVVPCMEVSSNFLPADRTGTRARTGMSGRPVFAWNARLHPIKDPLTALRGFSLIRRAWPEAKLHMIYYSTEMQTEVLRTIAADPNLSNAVEMRGTIRPGAVEDFFNSADFLIQASLQEVAGYSVLEAMSCGVIPVITDIPSFRAMTDNGRCGILFAVGDHHSMAEQTLRVDLANVALLSRKVRDFFVQSLSYDAIAKTYETALESGLSRNA